MGDPAAAKLDAAMAAVGGGENLAWLCRLALEEEAHVLGQGRPIVLENEQLIGASGADRFGDVLLAADGVDGDERAFEFEAREQKRNGDDLVALLVDRFLAEHQALARGPGRDQMQRRAAGRVRPASSLAVDRHNVGRLLAQALGPSDEAFGKQLGRQRVHDVVERIVRGNAAHKRQKAPEKRELVHGPALDVGEIFGAGHGPARHAAGSRSADRRPSKLASGPQAQKNDPKASIASSPASMIRSCP
jgi:hypothetical protein